MIVSGIRYIMKSMYIKFALSVMVFMIGHRIGSKNRKTASECLHNIIPSQRTSSLEDKDASGCCQSTITGTTHLHNNIDKSVLETVFGMLHHPSCPVTAELILTQHLEWKNDFSYCDAVYAFRTPTRTDHPNKCVGVMRIPVTPEGTYFSNTAIGHRIGTIDWPQKLSDQYQDDIVHFYSMVHERTLTTPMLQDIDMLKSYFLSIVGDPIQDNKRRTLVIMLANEGVMDLLLNFICSAYAAGVDLSNFIVFLGQPDYIAVIESMGVKSVFHSSLGDMPKEAAATYADRTFAKIMWLKVTSVYIALNAGFNVLFQDVDLVWMRDPVSYLDALDKHDIIFMDDGARTPRFAPYFTNTGFYYVRRNEKTLYMMEKLLKAVGEIDYTASHQATLIRHLTETQAAFGLQILVLDDNLFPSGRMYHEHPEFVHKVVQHKSHPYVWHMCWTANRDQKVEYYKELGLWFLPASSRYDGMCEDGPKMVKWSHDAAEKAKRGRHREDIKSRCCTAGGYWGS